MAFNNLEKSLFELGSQAGLVVYCVEICLGYRVGLCNVQNQVLESIERVLDLFRLLAESLGNFTSRQLVFETEHIISNQSR